MKYSSKAQQILQPIALILQLTYQVLGTHNSEYLELFHCNTKLHDYSKTSGLHGTNIDGEESKKHEWDEF